MAVHYTVIYGPDVCLTLFDAMQMAPGRGQKNGAHDKLAPMGQFCSGILHEVTAKDFALRPKSRAQRE